ncbi:MAG: universal stress protein [Bacteroidota bacterium]
MSQKKILVPTDFTSVGDNALNHAVTVGRAIGAEVHVLHVIQSKKFISEARLKLDTLASRLEKESGERIKTIVRIGSIFEDIDSVATEIEATMIIMGTHGLKGMQFLTGSRALKIVTDSTIPFIIVQEKGISETGYDDIVVPLDLHKETKQKLNLVAAMSKYFDGKAYLVSPGETDEYLKNQLDRNINYAKQFLEGKGVPFEVHITEGKSGSFGPAVVEYAKSVNADLISIMNFYENSLMGILGGSYEQQMITNEAQIAVMCLNPVETHVVDGSFFS